MTAQMRLPAAFMRGGTSNALVFHARDLPGDRAEWPALFCAAMGSPDPNGRQLDGMGGGISSLSKVCVIGPPTRPDADIDYTFFQIAVDRAEADISGNCGNMSSAMGPFAVDEGLVSAGDGEAVVRIHNTNTARMIHARFPVEDGRAAVNGDFSLPGVAGTGAPVRLDFLEPGGASTGRLLPTGRPVDRLDIPGLGALDVSIVDAANLCCFVRAADIGLTGVETPAMLEGDGGADAAIRNVRRVPRGGGALAALDAVRRAAGDAAGLDPVPGSIPKVGTVAPPAAFEVLSGERLRPADMDFAARMISVGRPHRAVPLTAALCLGVAARMAGTLVHEASGAGGGGDIRIGHPSGIALVAAEVSGGGGDGPHAERAVVYRTARRLMDGFVYAPRP
ncbi:MAG: PrpF family protein [Alphaproteobacteria bacterium]|nr:PrpF family protein [Alphaproteobacteria bacterium]